MMRILVLENEPSSRRGGQERSLLDVCTGLAGRGYEIDLLYTSEGDLLPRYASFCRRLQRVRAYSIDRADTIRAAVRLAADALSREIGAPDLVYANQYLDSAFGRLLSMRFGRPFVCHLRLPAPEIFCTQYRWGMAGAVRLIAISAQTRADFAARGFDADRISVVPNGIDTRVWQPVSSPAATRAVLGVPERVPLITYAGRLHPGKGIGVLVEALTHLPADVHLVLAGRARDDGSGRDYEGELRQRIGSLGLTDRVRLAGHVAAVADLFGASTVTALPSVQGEAFGRVLIESMACGTPAVGSRTGGIPSVLAGEFARGLFAPGDPRECAVAIGRVLQWRGEEPRFAERCRAHVEQHFQLARTVGDIDAIFRGVVAAWQAGGDGRRRVASLRGISIT
jgi:glycosyltransferase involved in cell wall biosynthesis